jgi:hypothetical protein
VYWLQEIQATLVPPVVQVQLVAQDKLELGILDQLARQVQLALRERQERQLETQEVLVQRGQLDQLVFRATQVLPFLVP